VEKVDLDETQGQYLYHDHAGFHFMDTETYETITLGEDIMLGSKKYLKENLDIEILYFENKPVSVELPMSVNLKVTSSAPGTRGDTSGKASKSAILETGLEINVPLFIEEGEIIKVDTRTGDYLGRA
jgi:elongation factor P